MPQATRSHSTPASRALGKAFAIPVPHKLPKATRAAVAQAIERHLAAVDGLVALLDLISEDADLEPALGSLNCIGPIVEGTPAHGFDQRRWALGNGGDLEDEHDGREPDDEAGLVPASGDGAGL